MALIDPYFLAAGVTLFLLPVLFISSFLLRGFFWKFLKVKSSQGRLTLLRVYTLTRDYFAVGAINDDAVRWKDNKGQWRTTPITSKGLIYQAWGINCLDTDEATNCFFKRDGTGVSSNDSEKNDSLIQRALHKPSQEKTILIVILVIGILTLLVGFGGIFLLVQVQTAVNHLSQIGTVALKAGVA